MNPIFLWLWFVGEICYIVGVISQFGFVAWMLTNYIFNLVLVSIMIRYWMFPKRSDPGDEPGSLVPLTPAGTPRQHKQSHA